ncbi:MAG: galactan 5-O-arabinofuranosyltransferase [Mycobacteriaceae bacterium]
MAESVTLRPARRLLDTLAELFLSALVTTAVAIVLLFAIAKVQWPAFTSSHQLQALTTVGQCFAVAALSFSVFLIRTAKWPRLAKLLSWMSLSAFSVLTLAMPLGATKLYLFGVSVDQQFRTEYLTRLTDSPALRDMTYADLPPYYPAGWFWIGGRIAAITSTAGWEIFKPYAITSIAIAITASLILWSKLVRTDRAILLALGTGALVLAYGSAEPYGAILAATLPPVLIFGWRGLTSHGTNGWVALLGVGLYLGFSATFYTLYTGFAAFTLVIMTLLTITARRRRHGWGAVKEPLLRLILIAALSSVLALSVWGPYLLAALRRTPASSGTALHYLPESGSLLPFPMLHFTLVGMLCMAGTIWILVRSYTSQTAQALGISVLTIYLWSLLSMLTTLAGTTLLSFRLEPLLLGLLGVAGICGFWDTASWLITRSKNQRRSQLVIIALSLCTAISFSQSIPKILEGDIAIAYSDTDGNGNRADLRPAGAESHYAEVDTAIRSTITSPRNKTVVLTADFSFLSYYPYLGFQGLTSHYANPLAQFDQRAKVIAAWAELDSPEEFITALDQCLWPDPTVFLFRQSLDNYTLRLAEDVYPNQPNVKRYTVSFPKTLFNDPRFSIQEIGPFVVVIRTA